MGIEMGEVNLYIMLFADDQIILTNDEDNVNYVVRKIIRGTN